MSHLSSAKQRSSKRALLSKSLKGAYHFIYLPPSKPARTIRVPRFVMTLTLLLLLVFVIVNSLILSSFYADEKNKQTLSDLQKENQNLRSEAEFLNTRLKLVQQGLLEVNNLSDKIKNLTKIEEKIEKQKSVLSSYPNKNHTYEKAFFENSVPSELGNNAINFFDINADSLEFRSLFGRVNLVEQETKQQIAGLKKLIIDTQLYNKFSQNYPDIVPIKGIVVSNFGWRLNPVTHYERMHSGIDISAPVGSPIFSSADGVVIKVSKADAYGLYVEILHERNIITRYAHLQNIYVQEGDKVRKGLPIATVGMSGRTTGPHLHYEIEADGKRKDPKDFIILW